MITFSTHLHDNRSYESSNNHFHQIKLSTILGHTLGSLHVDANLGIILFQSAQILNVRFCQKSCWTVQNKLTALKKPHVVFWAPGNTLVQGVFHIIFTYALTYPINYNFLRWSHTSHYIITFFLSLQVYLLSSLLAVFSSLSVFFFQFFSASTIALNASAITLKSVMRLTCPQSDANLPTIWPFPVLGS